MIVLLQIKDQYMRAVAELNQQNSQLQDELKTTRNNLKVANIQVDDLRKVLEELRGEMLLKVNAGCFSLCRLIAFILLEENASSFWWTFWGYG